MITFFFMYVFANRDNLCAYLRGRRSEGIISHVLYVDGFLASAWDSTNTWSHWLESMSTSKQRDMNYTQKKTC